MKNSTNMDIIDDTECPECDNCGMIDEPLINGYCEGCHCQRCGRNAGDTGCSMNDMGWCDDCESLMHMSGAEQEQAIASGDVPPVKQN